MLMTCVARAARSLGGSCCLAGAAFFVFEFVAVFDVVVELSASSNNNSLSVTTVAVVHVEVDVRAVLTASAFACSEAIVYYVCNFVTIPS